MDNIFEVIKKFIMQLFTEEIEIDDVDYEEQPQPKKSYPYNYRRFPYTILEPEKVIVDDDEYTQYVARFSSLQDLYDYLKSDPNINTKVFTKLSSVENDYKFAGKPYEEAVEDLIDDVDPGYEEFLELQKEFKSADLGKIAKYMNVMTPAGGHINTRAYLTNQPLIFETEERVVRPKFVRVYISLSYYCGTTKEQVLNRAIIVTNVIRALEKAGYSVDLETFELSHHEDELEYIVVRIKNHGETLNMSNVYKSLCHVEFLRRILFRVLETLDVKNDWSKGYGRTCNHSFVKEYLHIGDNDLYFDQPSEMGIFGDDLAEDFERAINELGIEDKIDVEKATKEFTRTKNKSNR